VTTTYLPGGRGGEAMLHDAGSPPAEPQPPKICILALSPIADDPRVRRQAEAFHRAGWTVVAVGLPGARSPDPEWRIMTSEDGRLMGAAAVAAVEAMAAEVETAPNPPTPAAVVASVTNPARIPVRSLMRRWLKQRGLDSYLLRRCASAVQATRLGLLNWLGSVFTRFYRIGVRFFRIGAFAVRAARTRLVNGVRSALNRYSRVKAALGPNGRAGYALRLLAIRLRPNIAHDVYWTFSGEIRNIYACARRVGAVVWLANDWIMLPVAARLADEAGGIYGYDTHEFAVEEYGDKRKWRLWHRPMVCALERAFIRDAAVVSAVSGGIAERLNMRYRLARPIMVIRNTPAYEQFPFRPTGDRVRILYHGIVTPGRGLEATIDSVVAWRPEFDLTIRGPGDAAYLDALQRRIEKSALNGRVWLAPPVPMTALVREAAAFDIGFFALPGSSLQFEFALPNKLFEYIMAGLAVCVTDLPEMGRLVRQYDLGMTIRKVEPDEIAAVVNAARRAQIDAYKRNALAAARELCWDRESERLVGAYSALLPLAAASAG
jgi:glycosyltransferase involved in cell wall biosynthesis